MRWVASRGLVGRPFLTGADFLEELPHLSPGVVVVELQSTGMNGFELIETVARARYECPVIAVLPEPDLNSAVQCLSRGAVDVVVRTLVLDALQEAVVKAEYVLEGRLPLAQQVGRDSNALARLSRREREVLNALALGRTTKIIAGQLSLSVRTLECYRASLVEKLGCGTSAAAIALMVRHDTFQQTIASFGAVTSGQVPQAA